jgi:hypothetical protein
MFEKEELRMSRVRREDAGSYTLQADNTVGFTTLTIHLNVTYSARWA